MKNAFITGLVFLFSAVKADAQTIQDAKQHIYYGKYESARTVLQKVISKGGAEPEAWYWLAENYLKQNKVDSASWVLRTMPKNPLADKWKQRTYALIYIAQGHVLLDSNKLTEAKAIFTSIVELFKYKDAGILLATAKANIDSKNGDPYWAIELLNEAVKKEEENPEIYMAFGDAYRRTEEGGKAVSNYELALDFNPRLARAKYREAMIYKTQSNTAIYLEHFNKAVEIDPAYGPALYELYYYYYFRDVVMAEKYLRAFIRNSEPDPSHAYMLTDLKFVSQKYGEAIKDADSIILAQGDNAPPRLFKLIAYSYAKLGDSVQAQNYIDKYFEKQQQKDLVAKDFDFKGDLLARSGKDSLSAMWYEKALAADSIPSERVGYMTKLADIQRKYNNRVQEQVLREQIYKIKYSPTNLDIYKWGTAAFYAKDYPAADSIFGIFAEKYPTQTHGYYWRARSNAIMDSSMALGLAVPHYQKLIEVAEIDSIGNKDVLLRAYEYLAAYEANVTKNYTQSIAYLDKLLALDPDDAEAKKNHDIIEKWVNHQNRTPDKNSGVQ